MRLNLGCGPVRLEGYENWDRKTGQEAYPLAVDDGSVEEIRASYVLEHFSHRVAGEVVKHWVEKLAPGGLLKIAVPDFEKVSRQYLDGAPIDVMGYVCGGHTDKDDVHLSQFDAETLGEAMVDAGLERIHVWPSDAEDCSALPVSLNLAGYKPTSAQKVEGVHAVLASARFGPSLHHRCAQDAFGRLGIPYYVQVGCFWHQILSEAIEERLADPSVTHVLTCDYDTLFTAQDVQELYRLARAYPEAKAIFPVQMKRACEQVLFSLEAHDGEQQREVRSDYFDMNLTRAYSGHFGLTLFDADALRAFPRPWMTPRPNTDGRWAPGPGRRDADIDFWENWQQAGNAVYIANRVVVGHMEELITWPDARFRKVYQTLEQYQAQGAPLEVVRK
jgi:hypothetical protein